MASVCRALVVLALAAALVLPVGHSSAEENFRPGEVLVLFRDGTPPSEARDVIETAGAGIIAPFEDLGIYHVTTALDTSVHPGAT